MTQFYLSKDLGSDVQNYREAIRWRLAQELESQSIAFDLKQVLDLGTRPKIPNCAVSIAHARGMGGFVWSLAETPVGFDVEETGRISCEAVRRICREAESYPHHDLMWVAKEASYKALGNLDRAPEVITQIEISNWSAADDGSFSYEFNGGKGRAWRDGDYSLALSEISQ